ncbi:MAG TPA: hypothetical protein VJN71_04920, partial [Nitrososphaerales archaeon]|nr:hypothetical protein [Nitrososphaerales archaeon]
MNPSLESQVICDSELSERASKKGRLVPGILITGFALTGIVFLLFITINGASGIPAIVPILTAVLLAVGLGGSAAGFILLRSTHTLRGRTRKGSLMQAIGLVGLFFGVIVAASSNLIGPFLISAVVLVPSTALAITGSVLEIEKSPESHARQGPNSYLLLVGMILLFFGTALIVAFNIFALTYYLSNVQAIIFENIGATISA